MIRNDIRYRRWVTAEAAVQVALVVALFFSIRLWALGWVANALVMPVLFATVVRRETGDPLRSADLVTGIRFLVMATTGALAFMLPDAVIVCALLFFFGEFSDFFDGLFARRYGGSSFGALWDMETDAAYGASMAHFLVAVFSYSPVFLLLGLMRYLFFLVLRRVPETQAYPGWYRWFSKTVAAAIAVVQIVAMFLAVWSLHLVGTILLAIVLVSQLASFALECWFLLRSPS